MSGTAATAAPTKSAVCESLAVLAGRPRLATAVELSEALGLSRQLIYRLVREDRIPHVRLGRPVRFDAGAVAKWLEQGGTADAR